MVGEEGRSVGGKYCEHTGYRLYMLESLHNACGARKLILAEAEDVYVCLR